MKSAIVRIVPIALVMAFHLASGPEAGRAAERKSEPRSETAVVQLPRPRLDGSTSVEKALSSRRSVRQFQDGPLTLAEVGQLLWSAQGITDPAGHRTAPSAGALYPLELYLAAGQVSGLPPGIYHYRPEAHALALVLAGDRRDALNAAVKNTPALKNAPVSLVFSAVPARTTGKYGQRGVRYVYMDDGHAAENVYLQAVALGLGTFVIGGFDDEVLRRAISLPPEEEPLSIMPAGRMRSR